MEIDEVQNFITEVTRLLSDDGAENDDEPWRDAGAKFLLTIDQITPKSDLVNRLTPKEYSKEIVSLLETSFIILANLSDANRPFDSHVWKRHQGNPSAADSPHSPTENRISFYELALSRSCSFVCQLLGDRFPYVQKLLIKYLFSCSDICSLFASDMYMFLIRIIHPYRQMTMCQIIMNLCKLAPPNAMAKGAALINRIKHPVVNFENPKYQYILEFS